MPCTRRGHFGGSGPGQRNARRSNFCRTGVHGRIPGQNHVNPFTTLDGRNNVLKHRRKPESQPDSDSRGQAPGKEQPSARIIKKKDNVKPRPSHQGRKPIDVGFRRVGLFPSPFAESEHNPGGKITPPGLSPETRWITSEAASSSLQGSTRLPAGRSKHHWKVVRHRRFSHDGLPPGVHSAGLPPLSQGGQTPSV